MLADSSHESQSIANSIYLKTFYKPRHKTLLQKGKKLDVLIKDGPLYVHLRVGPQKTLVSLPVDFSKCGLYLPFVEEGNVTSVTFEDVLDEHAGTTINGIQFVPSKDAFFGLSFDNIEMNLSSQLKDKGYIAHNSVFFQGNQFMVFGASPEGQRLNPTDKVSIMSGPQKGAEYPLVIDFSRPSFCVPDFKVFQLLTLGFTYESLVARFLGNHPESDDDDTKIRLIELSGLNLTLSQLELYSPVFLSDGRPLRKKRLFQKAKDQVCLNIDYTPGHFVMGSQAILSSNCGFDYEDRKVVYPYSEELKVKT